MVHHLLTVAPETGSAWSPTLAGGNNRSLVFTRTKHGAQKLTRQLARAGVSVVELHGNLEPGGPGTATWRPSLRLPPGSWWPRTSPPAASTSTASTWSSTPTRPPSTRPTCTGPAGTARAGAEGVVITVQSPAQAGDVRVLMRRAGVSPLAASVSPGSALVRSIAGPPAARVAPPGPRDAAVTALPTSPGTGRGAVAMSAG